MKRIYLEGNSLTLPLIDDSAHRRVRVRLTPAAKRRHAKALGLVRNNAVLNCVEKLIDLMHDVYQK